MIHESHLILTAKSSSRWRHANWTSTSDRIFCTGYANLQRSKGIINRKWKGQIAAFKILAKKAVFATLQTFSAEPSASLISSLGVNPLSKVGEDTADRSPAPELKLHRLDTHR